MSSELREFQLDEICDFVNGFAFKPENYIEKSADTYEVFRMGYISRGGGFKEDSSPVFVSRENSKLEKYRLRRDDIIIAMTDMKDKVAILGNTARVTDDDRFVLNQRAGLIRISRPDIVCPVFLYYYSNWKPHVDYLRARANSGVQVNLSTGAIKEAKITLPPIFEQRQIGNILSTLDDRIALLRETNTTLESIAQALFKSWFVDFDPVRAKMEGRAPEGMDEATAALFPDSFEESELGLMPRGWRVEPLDCVANFLNGLALQKFPPENEHDWLPVIKIAQLRKGDVSGADRASSAIKPEYIVRNGDVLFSWSGSLAVEIWCGGAGALNQHLFKVTSDKFPKWFYFFWTRHHLLSFQQIAASKATTMGHIQRKHLTEAKTLVPPQAFIEKADELFAPFMGQWINNALQVQSLASIRDTLLPRLISGQLRLSAH